MEVEENQPPQKKLKQATLSFFKGRKDDALPSKKSEPQGRKRQNSTGSESPSKIAKLSKPLAVLSSSDSPNSKATRQGSKSSIHDSSDQEVSSSSEADSTGNKSNGKSFMDRFVKKVPNDCNQEISSTNEDVGCTGDASHSKDKTSEIGKENICDESKKDDESCTVDSDSDCVMISENGKIDDAVESKANDVAETSPSKTDDNKTVSVENNEQSSESIRTVEKEISKSEENTNTLVADNSDSDNIVADTADIDKSIEIDPNASFTSTLDEKSDSLCTSTPAKSAAESTDNDGTPKSITSSGKKKGKKIDMAKRAEKEALRQKQKEEREEQRLAKKKKLEEEKAEKEKLRKEKQDAKDKAKQELKDKLEQERKEKEKSKEEDKMKKEEERKLKEEQRLKKQAELEAKQEEKKKKEEERKLKEEEKQKEEEEKKKKEAKVKMAFHSFFKAKETPQKPAQSKSSSAFFVPFELKKDMHLAPALRRDALCQRKRDSLDEALKPDQLSTLTYLEQLKSKALKPTRMGRRSRKNPKPEEEMEIEIVHDSEALKKVIHKVKILQFHTDHRPPYFGTWRRETKLTPRNPYRKDEDVFDYDVDSDEEWEEEEPGESLSCSDGEEEKEEKEEEEEEDDWMVPHGYLSEDEGCNEDDDISPEKLKLQQIAKAKAWDEEQKRKFHAVPVVVVGCFFEHSPSVAMSGDVRLLYQYKAVVLEKVTPIPTALSSAFELPTTDDASKEGRTTPVVKGCKKRSVPDDAMSDLIRLVHGNTCGIKRLIKEFRVFWLQKNEASTPNLNGSYEEDPDESIKEPPADVSMDDSGKDLVGDVLNKSLDANSSLSKPKEEGHGCSISKRQLEIKIMAMAIREKRQCLKKTSWFVHDSVLTEFSMTDIQLPNSWVFLTAGPTISPAPKNASTPAPPKEEDAGLKKDESNTPAKPTPKDQRSIMDFTVTKEEFEELKQSQGESLRKSADISIVQEQKAENTAATTEQPSTPKEKKSGGQRSIMDFAKSAAKCSEKNEKSKIVTVVDSPDLKITKNDVKVSNPDITISNTVVESSGKNEKGKTAVDSSDVIMIEEDDAKSCEAKDDAKSCEAKDEAKSCEAKDDAKSCEVKDDAKSCETKDESKMVVEVSEVILIDDDTRDGDDKS